MSHKQIEHILFIISIICTVNTISITVIPEYVNNNHFAHVEQCEIPCEYYKSHENPDAELYIAMNDDDITSTVCNNSTVPIRILGSNEGQHYHHLLKLEYLKHHFQGSALLDKRSDIPWVLMRDMDKMKGVQSIKGIQPKATFVARNCKPMNNRNDYVNAIDAKIGVVSLSSCMNNAKWPDCNGRPCSKVEALRPYKMHLAFENGNSPGYISEKIYDAFEAGVVPVWMGTRDIAETIPKGSYIDVDEFDSPDDVANYLKLVLDNETLYNSYFEWKNKPFDPEYVRNNRVLWSESVFCRICHYVDTLQRRLEWDHLRQRAKSSDVNNGFLSSDLKVNLPDKSNPDRIPQKQIDKRCHIIDYMYISAYPSSNRTLSIFIIIIICLSCLIIFRRKYPVKSLLLRLYRK